MKVRLSRIFGIFHPYGAVSSALTAFMMAFLFFGIISEPENQSPKKIFTAILFAVAVGFAIIAFSTLIFPKELVIDKDSISYRAYSFQRHSGVSFVRTRGIPHRVDFCVSRIRTVEFRQNAVERFFDVGRIRFSGNTCFESKYYEDDDINVKLHTVCGIKSFSLFKKEISKYIDIPSGQ